MEQMKQKLKALKSSPVDEVVPIQEKKYSAPVIIKNQKNDNQEQRFVDIMGQKCDSLEQSSGGVQAQKYSGAKEQGSDGCGGGYRNIINEEKCPFDDVKIIASKQLTQNGDVLDFEHCGLKVTVPEGAIEEDYCVEIQVATTEQRYMEQNMFKNLNTRVNITKRDELNVSDPCSVIGWNAIHLLATKISVDEINFRELYKSAEDIKKDEIRDIYPPRFITQLNCHQRCTLDVTYTLNLLRDGIIIKDYKFSIFIEGPGSISMDSANSEILQKEPEIGDLFEFVVPSIKAHWDDVAHTALRYDIPTVESIKREHPNDVRRCCQKMFKIWLTTSHGIRPKTWSNLLTRLKKVDELVASTEVIEKKLKAYSCDNS